MIVIIIIIIIAFICIAIRSRGIWTAMSQGTISQSFRSTVFWTLQCDISSVYRSLCMDALNQ